MELKEAVTALLDEFHLANYAYHVRDAARESGDGFKGNSWDHPKVKRFSEVVTVLENYRKEKKGKGK